MTVLYVLMQNPTTGWFSEKPALCAVLCEFHVSSKLHIGYGCSFILFVYYLRENFVTECKYGILTSPQR